MIKVETVGMIQRVVAVPTLKSDKDVINHTLAVIDGKTYLIHNVDEGDDSYIQDRIIKAGEFLNGYELASLVGQKLVIDAKEIAGDVEAAKGDTLAVGDDGKLEIGGTAADVTLTVTDTNVVLTEPKAVKAMITVE